MVDLRRLAEELNIDDIAVCHARRFEDVERILLKDLELGILPPFVNADIEKRINPKETMSDAKGFIVILEHYEPASYKKREGRFGNISPAACGEDYHRIVQRKLNALSDALQCLDPDGKYMAFVDNSPFSEKHTAMRAGLGKILKNGLLYSKQYGSRCFIGLVLTNRYPEFFEIDKRDDAADVFFERCKNCHACISLCPGQALSEEGMNSYRCISYLTQKKEPLTDEEKNVLGDHIYGCDICQKVCPLNHNVSSEYETGMEVSLDDMMNITNKAFNQVYKPMAAGWRGKKQLQKNAQIVLENMER